MRTGDDAGRQSAGAEEVEAAASVRGGRRPAVQTDGLLLQGGALVRREGGHDIVREAANPGA